MIERSPSLSDNCGLTEANVNHSEVVELTAPELDVLVAAVDCCHSLGGQLSPSQPELWKRARGKLLFAHRKAWLRANGLEEPLTELQLAALRAALLAGSAWSPEHEV